MTKRALFFSALLTLASIAGGMQQAHAEARLSVVGELAFSDASGMLNGQDLQASAKSGLGIGAMLEWGVPASAVQFELGAFYLNRRYDRDNYVLLGSSVAATFSSSQLMIPGLVRVYVLPFLSLGGGLYYSQTLGSVTVETQIGESSASASELGLKSQDWGWVLSAQARLPLNQTSALIGDVRFSGSVGNSSTSEGDTLNYKALYFIAGYQFAL